MPPLPVITNVFRVTLPWQSASQVVKPVNVFHVRTTSASLSAIGTLLAGQLAAHGGDMFNALYTGYTLPSIEILPLDGVTTTYLQAVTGMTAPSGSGGVLPALAQVVSFHTTQRGSRGRGRLYCGPVGETQVNDGSMNSTTNATTLGGWQAFITGISGGTPSTNLVVASYVHADAHDVTSIRVDTVCGTQRRRQNQLR